MQISNITRHFMYCESRRLLYLCTIICISIGGRVVHAGGPPPVVVESVEPTELVIIDTLAQRDILVFGTDLVVGIPSKTNRPTVTLRHVDGIAEFSALAWVNIYGTTVTVTKEQMNLTNAPLGFYDVIVTRPDKQSDTLEAALAIKDGYYTPGSPQLKLSSYWGGPVGDVEVVGDLAYAAIGQRFVVLDISNEMNPVEIGSLNIPRGVGGVAVSGDYAFLGAMSPYRFTVVDISNPSAPALVSAGHGGLSFPNEVHLRGNLAYTSKRNLFVGGGGNTIGVLDVSDPLNVIDLGPLPSSVGSVLVMTISGDLLYVGGGRIDAGACDPPQGGCTLSAVELRIFDLAVDPLNPPLVGSVITNLGEGDGTQGLVNGGESTAISVEGDYAVWTIQDQNTDDYPNVSYSFRVADVSNPAAPMVVGSSDIDGDNSLAAFTDVILSDGIAYIADTSVGPQYWILAEGLAIYDIATDPANPTLVGAFKPHGNISGVKIFGDRAYAFDDGEG